MDVSGSAVRDYPWDQLLMGYCFDIVGLGVYQSEARERLYDLEVLGEFSSLYIRFEGTKVGPLVG